MPKYLIISCLQRDNDPVEAALKAEIPEIGRVYLINETDQDLIDFAKKLMSSHPDA